MACKDCALKYIGQTRHTFRTRYKEHIREIKTVVSSSAVVPREVIPPSKV
jgi:hypothetical protein